eukprot:TRINITY_DN22684_c0_g1_i2.p1 TRINITY_DN22684_c0_g1~~TRINITY_DN22684_c0_g1_i2.p1  ORF type:complete len:529 (-),score=68.14 TRINITY_DN22684_c0_g1_i2:264-1850(-)
MLVMVRKFVLLAVALSAVYTEAKGETRRKPLVRKASSVQDSLHGPRDREVESIPAQLIALDEYAPKQLFSVQTRQQDEVLRQNEAGKINVKESLSDAARQKMLYRDTATDELKLLCRPGAQTERRKSTSNSSGDAGGNSNNASPPQTWAKLLESSRDTPTLHDHRLNALPKLSPTAQVKTDEPVSKMNSTSFSHNPRSKITLVIATTCNASRHAAGEHIDYLDKLPCSEFRKVVYFKCDKLEGDHLKRRLMLQSWAVAEDNCVEVFDVPNFNREDWAFMHFMYHEYAKILASPSNMYVFSQGPALNENRHFVEDVLALREPLIFKGFEHRRLYQSLSREVRDAWVFEGIKEDLCLLRWIDEAFPTMKAAVLSKQLLRWSTSWRGQFAVSGDSIIANNRSVYKLYIDTFEKCNQLGFKAPASLEHDHAMEIQWNVLFGCSELSFARCKAGEELPAPSGYGRCEPEDYPPDCLNKPCVPATANCPKNMYEVERGNDFMCQTQHGDEHLMRIYPSKEGAWNCGGLLQCSTK